MITMFKKHIFIALAISLVFPMAVVAVEWKIVKTSKDYVYYIDQDSVMVEGDLAYLWGKVKCKEAKLQKEALCGEKYQNCILKLENRKKEQAIKDIILEKRECINTFSITDPELLPESCNPANVEVEIPQLTSTEIIQNCGQPCEGCQESKAKFYVFDCKNHLYYVQTQNVPEKKQDLLKREDLATLFAPVPPDNAAVASFYDSGCKKVKNTKLFNIITFSILIIIIFVAIKFILAKKRDNTTNS